MLKSILTITVTTLYLLGLAGCGSEGSNMQTATSTLAPRVSISDAYVVEGSSEGVTNRNYSAL